MVTNSPRGHRLATQLSGTGWLTGGMGWDDQAKNPTGSILSATARDASGGEQRFTKPLLAGADAVVMREEGASTTKAEIGV